MNAASSALPVRSQPVLPLGAVIGRQGLGAPAARAAAAGNLPWPLGSPRAVMTFSGTAAIYQAVRALGLPAGATVLAPSYNCGHEIEPLIRLGLRVQPYRVMEDLGIDLDDVERGLAAGAAALFVTHYFGFAQHLAPLRALCDRHGARLIEDCAHALLSDDDEGRLGRTGDVAIFSMRKTLPLPNGGAFVLNDPGLAMPAPPPAAPRASTWLKATDLIAKASLDRYAASRRIGDLLWLPLMLPAAAAVRVVRHATPPSIATLYDPDDEDYAFDESILDWGISRLSARLLRNVDWNGIVARRRENYRRLAAALEGLEGARALRPELPARTNPLYVPVRSRDPVALFRALRPRGIHTDVYWQQAHPAIDWSRYPEASALKREVLVLPVHQDIDEARLAQFERALREAGGRSA